jgi:glycosyltransferase involved in cell wall biosynthesis
MNIGILLPSIYFSEKYKDMIFAPKPLAISLANGLVDHGHTVYLFASTDIKTKANLVGGENILIDQDFINQKLLHAEENRKKWGTFYLKKNLFDLDLTQKAYTYAKEGKVDIIHSYHDIFSHFFDGITNVPTVYTLHDPLPPTGTYEYWFMNKFKDHQYVSISNAYRKGTLALHYVDTVYHGIDLSEYPYIEKDSGYCLFMSRLVKEKGLHTALQVVIQLRLPLKIASDFSSNVNNSKDDYFINQIQPYLSHSTIDEVGMTVGLEKTKLLGNARALLFPIEWEEPFGMVMIEAMATGTPVIAFARGSVPEIVNDGETGFIINSSEEDKRGDFVIKKTGYEGFLEAVQRIYSMSVEEYGVMRRNCRTHVEKNFTVENMVTGYEAVYEKVIGSRN